MYLHDLALSYYKFGYYDVSAELMEIAMQYPAFSQNLDIQRYNTLGLSYLYLGHYDKALVHLYQVLSVSEGYKDSIWLSLAHSGMGLVFSEQQNWDSSLYHHRQAYDILKNYFTPRFLAQTNPEEKLNDSELLAVAHLRLIQIYLKMNKLSEARTWLQPIVYKEISFIGKTQHYGFFINQLNEKSTMLYYEVMKDYYNLMNDVYNAKKYTDSFYILKNKIDTKYTANVIQVSEANLLLSKKKVEIEQYKSQQQINLFVTILLTALLVILILIVLIIRSRKKKSEVEHDLKQRELQFSLQREREKFQSAQEELSLYLNTLTKKNELIEEITSELESIKVSHLIQEEAKDISGTIDKLKVYRILTDEDWLEFQVLYKKVNHELYQKIWTYEPAFTESEKRYLLLISLNLNKKEIAGMLGISPDSLRVTWIRLKKKLPVGYDTQAQDFIQYLLEKKMDAIAT